MWSVIFIVITRSILRAINTIPIFKPGKLLYRKNCYTEDRYTGVLPHTFYNNFCWANE